MYSAFLKICKLISNEFLVIPLLYGSLGLERLTGEPLNADDIDILIPSAYVRGNKWIGFKSYLETNGYMLIDEHEHTFKKDGVYYSFACIEELESFADILQRSIPIVNDHETCFYLLTLEQYLAVYTRSSADGYRMNKKEKRDHEKIALIQQKLNETSR